MNRIDLLSQLVQCSREDDKKSIENLFGKLIHEFKPLYVFYDILKAEGIDICRFQSPIIEGNEITFFFHIKKTEMKTLKALDGTHKCYKNTNTEFLVSFADMGDELAALTLTKILKGRY